MAAASLSAFRSAAAAAAGLLRRAQLSAGLLSGNPLCVTKQFLLPLPTRLLRRSAKALSQADEVLLAHVKREEHLRSKLAPLLGLAEQVQLLERAQ